MCSRGAPRAAALVILLCVGTLFRSSHAEFQQQDSPLKGQGMPNSDVSDAIHVSAFLERLLEVDTHNYRFQSEIFIYVTWQDLVGVRQWFANNFGRICDSKDRPDAEEVCTFAERTCASNDTDAVDAFFLGPSADEGVPGTLLCDSLRAFAASGPPECAMPCRNDFASDHECCDDIFVPDIQMTNTFQVSQDSATSNRIFPQLPPLSLNMTAPFGTMFRARRLHATYCTNMIFKDYPWGTQKLDIEMKLNRATNVIRKMVLVPSAASQLKIHPQARGDWTPGWHVRSVDLRAYDIPNATLAQVRGTAVPAAESDPLPFFATAGSGSDRKVSGVELVFDRELSPGTQVVFTIEVAAFWTYHFTNVLVPVILCTYLGFVVFLVSPEDIKDRLALLVTLFLALTAIQFVISQDLPASSYILKSQALVLTGYVFLFAIALVAWAVSAIARHHTKKERLQLAGAAPSVSDPSLSLLQQYPSMSTATRHSLDQSGSLDKAMSTALAQQQASQQQMNPSPFAAPYGGSYAAAAPPPAFAAPQPQRKPTLARALQTAHTDPHAAGFLAESSDRCAFWVLMVIYTVVMIVILAT